MDYLDMAQSTADLLLEIDLVNESERRERERVLPAVGRCHNCDASVPSGAKFCDCDCRDDYDKRQRYGARRAA